MKKRKIKIPDYTIQEELLNSITHGIGGALSIWGLVMLILKAIAKGPKAVTCIIIFGASMISMYIISCLYHAFSKKLTAKKVFRVIDHCNVYLLVLGTILPVSLLGIQGTKGMFFFLAVSIVTIIGITFTVIDIDRFKVISVFCHLFNGWSALFFLNPLLEHIGLGGVILIILGGTMYSIGAILYGLGSKKRYMHSICHLFCLLGTFFHYLAIYCYVL